MADHERRSDPESWSQDEGERLEAPVKPSNIGGGAGELERTTSLIAHELRLARDVDRILVVDEGRVAEEGTREELLAIGGLFPRLHALQGEDLASDGPAVGLRKLEVGLAPGAGQGVGLV